MILCIGPNDKVQISTDVSIPLHVHVSGMDVDASGNVTTYRKNTLNGSWLGLADAMVPAASGVTRNVKTINIKNSSSTLSATITVLHTDGTTSVELVKTPLAAGQTLQYIEGLGWSLTQGIPVSLEMDYVQLTADSAAIAATTEATAVTVITGNAVVYDGATKVEVHFFSPGIFSSAANQITIVLFRDGNPIGQIRGYGTAQSANTIIAWPGETFFVDTPPAGSHTYSIGAFVSANNSTFKAGPGGSGNYLPMFLRVTRAVGATGPQGPQGFTGASGVQAITNASQLAGSPTDGQVAWIDIPGEGIVPVMYDASATHWVSPPVMALRFGTNETSGMWSVSSATWAEADAISTAVSNPLSRVWLPMGVWDAAGFKPQFRIRGSIRVTATPTNALLRASYATSSINGSRSAFNVPIAGAAIAHNSTNWKVADSGWLDVPVGYTVQDLILWSAQFSNTSGANNAQVTNLMIESRWVV